LRRLRIVLVMCENSSRHRSNHRLQINKWLQTLMRRIDSRRQNEQSSFRIQQSLSKTIQNSSTDYRLEQIESERRLILNRANNDDICKHSTWRRDIKTYFNTIE
jgi:hypothetical protein